MLDGEGVGIGWVEVEEWVEGRFACLCLGVELSVEIVEESVADVDRVTRSVGDDGPAVGFLRNGVVGILKGGQKV